MATVQIINVSTPNDGLGDTLRNSQVKANSNFAELNTKKVEVSPGMGLSSNDYTTAEQNKLAGIETGAQVNVRPNYDQTDPSAPDFILGAKPGLLPTLFILDGIIDTTSGFSNGQVDFVLPTSEAIAQRVILNGYPQYKTTPNNSVVSGRWSQTGNIVTLTNPTASNDYVYIEYI